MTTPIPRLTSDLRTQREIRTRTLTSRFFCVPRAVGLYDGDYVIGWCDTLARAIALGIRLLFVRGWKNYLSDETVTEGRGLRGEANALWAKLGPPPERDRGLPGAACSPCSPAFSSTPKPERQP